MGAAELGRAAAQGRAIVAEALASVSEIDHELARLRVDAESGQAFQRTSVMTHLAWVPAEWVEAAEDVLAGLAERHPSRTSSASSASCASPRPRAADRSSAPA